MKHRNICPKCGSNNLLVVPGKAGAYGAGNNIPVGMTIFTYVLVDRYVCRNCGFSEEWIREEDITTLEKSPFKVLHC